MKIVENKYGLQITEVALDEYIDRLVDDTFKLLPLYEGRDWKTKKIIKSPEEAYIDFQKYLKGFIIEVAGGFYLFDDNIKFLRLLLNLEGMQEIQIKEHAKIKSIVFKCTDLCKKLKGGN